MSATYGFAMSIARGQSEPAFSQTFRLHLGLPENIRRWLNCYSPEMLGILICPKSNCPKFDQVLWERAIIF